MTALQYVLSLVIIVVALAIIVLVILQESKTKGLSGAIAGGADNFFGKNKGRTMEAKLIAMTKVAGGLFFVLALVSSILVLFGI